MNVAKLTRPVGQFTHYYMDEFGDPRYLILEEGTEVNFNEDLCKALSATQANGRYLIAVFTVNGEPNSGNQTMTLHRVSNEFPYELFEKAKSVLADNLDEEYKPVGELRQANILNANNSQEVFAKLQQMNDEAAIGPD